MGTDSYQVKYDDTELKYAAGLQIVISIKTLTVINVSTITYSHEHVDDNQLDEIIHVTLRKSY